MSSTKEICVKHMLSLTPSQKNLITDTTFRVSLFVHSYQTSLIVCSKVQAAMFNQLSVSKLELQRKEEISICVKPKNILMFQLGQF